MLVPSEVPKQKRNHSKKRTGNYLDKNNSNWMTKERGHLHREFGGNVSSGEFAEQLKVPHWFIFRKIIGSAESNLKMEKRSRYKESLTKVKNNNVRRDREQKHSVCLKIHCLEDGIADVDFKFK